MEEGTTKLVPSNLAFAGDGDHQSRMALWWNKLVAKSKFNARRFGLSGSNPFEAVL